MKSLTVAFLALCMSAFAGAPALGQPAEQTASSAVTAMVRGERPRPRLVVVISVDQFRGDYLLRLADLFQPAEDATSLGGFQYLMHAGAYFPNARYEHLPLFTGPSHAVLLTGASPNKSGIIGNDWWDPVAGKRVYAVDDPRWSVVGAAAGSTATPMGPANLRCSTVGDELKLATASSTHPRGRAKVVTLALKDRPAILMGGHAQDVCLWFDTEDGRWISSTAFCRDGKLPAWAATINETRPFGKLLDQVWSAALDPAVLASRSLPPSITSKTLPPGFGTAFPHHVGAEPTRDNYRAFALTPSANEFVLRTAQQAVESEQLGQRGVSDILAINLSTNDYIGHAFGPYSPEAVEMTVATDRLLGRFFSWLNTTVGMSNIVVVLTGDHGVAPIPEDVTSRAFNLNGGRFEVRAVVSRIARALTARFGAPTSGTWFSSDPRDPETTDLKKSGMFMEGLVYLNREAVRSVIERGKASSRRDVEQAACDALNGDGIPGVYACYGKTQILEGRVADNELRRHLSLGVHPQLTGDLIVLQDQFYLQDPMPDGHATSHGTPYAYDTHVPLLLCAPGTVRPGVYLQRVSPADIAPTLSLLLGIESPSGCDGSPLIPALVP